MKRTLIALSLLAAATAQGAERHHGAHEHGVAELDVVVAGAVVAMALRSPAANIVGFEHEPGNDAQHKAVDAARALLERGQWLVLNGEAGCTLTDSEVHTKGLGEDHGHDDDKNDDDDHHDEGHADFTAEYSFQCDSPAALRSLTVNLFDDFPGTEHIEAQVIGPKGQAGAELTSERRELTF